MFSFSLWNSCFLTFVSKNVLLFTKHAKLTKKCLAYANCIFFHELCNTLVFKSRCLILGALILASKIASVQKLLLLPISDFWLHEKCKNLKNVNSGKWKMFFFEKWKRFNYIFQKFAFFTNRNSWEMQLRSNFFWKMQLRPFV